MSDQSPNETSAKYEFQWIKMDPVTVPHGDKNISTADASNLAHVRESDAYVADVANMQAHRTRVEEHLAIVCEIAEREASALERIAIALEKGR